MPNNIETRANRYFTIKIAANIVLMVIGALIISLLLTRMQRQVGIQRQKDDTAEVLSEVVENLNRGRSESAALTKIYHDGNQDTLEDLRSFLTGGLFDTLMKMDSAGRIEEFGDMTERAGEPYLFLIDESGKIVLTASEKYYGADIASVSNIAEEDLASFVKGTRSEDGDVHPLTEYIGGSGYYFYSEPLTYGNKQYTLVLGKEKTALESQIGALGDVGRILGRFSVCNSGSLIAVDLTSGEFVYNTASDCADMTASGLNQAVLRNGYSGTQRIGGEKYYCMTRLCGENTAVIAAAPLNEIYDADNYVLLWSISGFVLVMLLCLNYAVIVRNDFVHKSTETVRVPLMKIKGRQIFLDRTLLRRVLPLMVLGAAMIMGISFYTQTLLSISNAAEDGRMALAEASTRYEESMAEREIVITYYNDRFLAKTKLLAYLLEEDPAALNEKTDRDWVTYDKDGARQFVMDSEGNVLRSVDNCAYLREFCEKNDLEDIWLINEDGRTIAASNSEWYYELPLDENDPAYELRMVLDGKMDDMVRGLSSDSTGNIGVGFYYYTTTDDSGNTVYVSYRDLLKGTKNITEHRGLIVAKLKSELVETMLASTDIDRIFTSSSLSGGFIMLFDDSDEHKVVYSPLEYSIGRAAEEMGISDMAFTQSYYGFQTIAGVQYFQYYTYLNGYYAATAIPVSSMFVSRGQVTLLTALVSLIMILVLSATIILTTADEELLYKAMSSSFREHLGSSRIFNIILPSGQQSTTASAASRWDNKTVHWWEKSPEQKLMTLLGGLFVILAAYVVLSVIGANTFFDQGSIVIYILKGNWQRGMNIFAFSAGVIVVIITMLSIAILRMILSVMTGMLGARSETVSHLLLSVAKYGGTLACLFYCLYLLGLDATSLLASAGILSLVIGLGAQSLITDIIAGVFIVFEGDFRVGDIVTVGDFRGTVMDIGLRTTKIINVEGNIKIFNNSTISGVLNMTKEDSVSRCFIGVEYGQDLDEIEALLNAELPKIAEKDERFKSAPRYAGVAELKDSCVNLLIVATCAEKDVWAVGAVMNREILQIFYDHNINVPFPQVTISERVEPGEKE